MIRDAGAFAAVNQRGGIIDRHGADQFDALAAILIDTCGTAILNFFYCQGYYRFYSV